MPLDTSIATSIKPPQLPTVQEMQQQQLNLKNQGAQQKIQQQQLQINDQTLVKGQREIAKGQEADQAQKDYEDIVRKSTTYDPDKGISIDHGAVENSLIQMGHPDVAMAHAKSRAEVDKAAYEETLKELEVHKTKATRIAAIAQGVLAADAKDKPGRYAMAIQTAAQEGLLDPAQMHQVPQNYDPATTDSMLQQLVDQSMDAKDQMTQAEAKVKSQRDAVTAKADLLKKNVENESQILGSATDQATWDNARAQLTKDRQDMYPATFSEQARQQVASMGMKPERGITFATANTPDEFAAVAAKGGKDGALAQKALDLAAKYHINLEVAKIRAANEAALGPGANNGKPFPVAPAGQRNDAVLASVNPGVATTVKQLVDYKIPLPSGMALKTPYWQQILQLAGQYDPDFDASQYNVRLKLRQDFTSGKAADNIRSLNTVVGHLDTLDKAAKALDNSTLKRYNSVANWLANETGDQRVTNFKLAINAVASELTKVFRGTGGAEADIKAWKDSIDASNSPEQLRGAIDSAIELMGSRMAALDSQYEKGMGKPRSFSFLDSRARKILKNLGADVDALDPVVGSAGMTPAPAPTVAAPATTTNGKKITEDLITKGLAHNKMKDTPANRQAISKAMEDAGYVK